MKDITSQTTTAWRSTSAREAASSLAMLASCVSEGCTLSSELASSFGSSSLTCDRMRGQQHIRSMMVSNCRLMLRSKQETSACGCTPHLSIAQRPSRSALSMSLCASIAISPVVHPCFAILTSIGGVPISRLRSFRAGLRRALRWRTSLAVRDGFGARQRIPHEQAPRVFSHLQLVTVIHNAAVAVAGEVCGGGFCRPAQAQQRDVTHHNNWRARPNACMGRYAQHVAPACKPQPGVAQTHSRTRCN